MSSVRVRNRGFSVLETSETAMSHTQDGSAGSRQDGASSTLRTVRKSLPSMSRTGSDARGNPEMFTDEPQDMSRTASPVEQLDADPERVGEAPRRAAAFSVPSPAATAPSSRAKPRAQTLPSQPSRLAAALGVPGNDKLHASKVVDHLDVIDGHVATVSGLTNVANSILIPPLPFANRAPVVDLHSVEREPSRSRVTLAEDASDEKPLVEQHEIDKHVAEVLSNRETLKRQLRGLWAFLKTPMGIVMAIYGFLVAFWGAAIVFFLGKLINLHNAERQAFWVELTCQIENALFTITGVGLIPWRAIDTYRIVRIWHYQRLIRKRRQQRGLPPLEDENDIPDPTKDPDQVLEPRRQEMLVLQQTKFAKSQTWYIPHMTDTHKAFPISTALWICLLTDGNSFFQCLLCGCMWGMDRYTRPAWTTGTLVPASFLCGIAAAVFIWYGGKKTKRTAEVEERLRSALEKPVGSVPELQPSSLAAKGADYDEEASIQQPSNNGHGRADPSSSALPSLTEKPPLDS